MSFFLRPPASECDIPGLPITPFLESLWVELRFNGMEMYLSSQKGMRASLLVRAGERVAFFCNARLHVQGWHYIEVEIAQNQNMQWVLVGSAN